MASNISCSNNSTNSYKDFLINAIRNIWSAKDDSESLLVVTGISSLNITNSLSSCSQSEEAEDQSIKNVIEVKNAEIIDDHCNQEIIKETKHAVPPPSSSDIITKNSQSLPCVMNKEEVHGDDDDIEEGFITHGSASEKKVVVVEKKIDSYEPFKEKRIERWITYYSSSHSILLVGEGDFSFSACLAWAFGSASNMVATSLDSKGMLCRRLPSSELHIEYLRELGCLVLHEVNVHDMASAYPELVNIKFDRIVFNFPHSGHFGLSGENEINPRVIKRHKTLLSGFFKSSSKMLSGIGEVHVAHRDDHPYSAWDIGKLADEAGLTLITKLYFCWSEYPGYRNKRGSYSRPSECFPLGNCPTTFKFSLKLS